MIVPRKALLVLLSLSYIGTHAVHAFQSRKPSSEEPTKVYCNSMQTDCGSTINNTHHQLEELRDRMLDSKDGVIDFDNEDFSTYVEGESRPYSLVVMATAAHLMDKQQLGLRLLRKNFGLVARALQQDVLAQRKQGGGDFDKVRILCNCMCALHHHDIHQTPVFFVQLELGHAQQSFNRLDIKALPFVAHIPGALPVPHGAAVPLSDADKMDPNRHPNYPWKPDSFADFVAEVAGYRVNVPEPPSLFKSRYFPLVALGAIALGGVMAYQLYYAPFMRIKALYMIGGLVVYWFSVSGGMYNIIRGMPMFVPREDGAQFFLQGSGQLGAEGFMMGATYTAFGVSVAMLSLLAPRIRSTTGQRLLCYGCLGVAMFSLSGLLNVYKWKLGYHVHSYLFG